MVMLPPKDSRRARGWITVSEPIATGYVPVRTASSAIVTEEEKETGGLGPARLVARLMFVLLLSLRRTLCRSAFPTYYGCQDGVVGISQLLLLSLFAREHGLMVNSRKAFIWATDVAIRTIHKTQHPARNAARE